MASQSIAGLNVKIGADTKELQDELGKVTGIIQDDLEPAKDTTKSLADNFKSISTDSVKTAAGLLLTAGALAGIGKAINGFTKGIVEDALKVDPVSQQAITDLSDAFQSIKLSLGEAILPSLTETAKDLTDLLNKISGWLKENDNTAAAIMKVVGAVGLLSSGLAIAAPVLQLFGISFAGLLGPVAAVAAVIAGVVILVGLLKDNLGEADEATQAFADSLETLDTSSQTVVQNGYGQLEIEDYKYTDRLIEDEETGDFITVQARLDEATQTWITRDEDLARAAEKAGEALSGQAQAVESVTDAVDESTLSEGLVENVEETKTTADEANEVLKSVQDTIANLGQTTMDTDLSESMSTINGLLESEAFKQFAKEPVDPAIGESWTTFGTAIQSASGGFESLNTTLGDGTISGYISGTGDAAKGAAEGFSALAEAINAVVGAYNDLARTNPTGGGTPAGGGSSAANNQTDVFRAGGGPVLANHPYIVGEFRPEIFIPGEDGMIVPTAGGITVNVGNVYGESYLRDYVTRTVTGAIRQEVRLGA